MVMADMTHSKAQLPDRRTCSSVVKCALAYADRDWAVLPVSGKVPLKGSRGLHDATTDSRRIRQVWETCPGAGVAIRTGAESGVVTIDIDLLKGGPTRLRTWRPGMGHSRLRRGASPVLEATTTCSVTPGSW